MNYDFNGQKHRFVYGNCVADSALAKEVTFPPAIYWADETSWVHPSSLVRVICHEKPEGFEGWSIFNAIWMGNRFPDGIVIIELESTLPIWELPAGAIEDRKPCWNMNYQQRPNHLMALVVIPISSPLGTIHQKQREEAINSGRLQSIRWGLIRWWRFPCVSLCTQSRHIMCAKRKVQKETSWFRQ